MGDIAVAVQASPPEILQAVPQENPLHEEGNFYAVTPHSEDLLRTETRTVLKFYKWFCAKEIYFRPRE